MAKICKKGATYGALVGVSLLVVVTVVLGFTFPGFSNFEKVKPANGMVTVSVDKVSDGNAHYYRLDAGGKGISFFIVKGSDGVLHTAFDACDVCYGEKKGYKQKGGEMICKNCSKRYAIVRIGADSDGGCNPSHLAAKVNGGNVVIRLADLLSGARLF